MGIKYVPELMQWHDFPVDIICAVDGFLEAARYIAVALPVVVAKKRADMLLIPSGAGPSVSSSGGLAGEWQLVLYL